MRTNNSVGGEGGRGTGNVGARQHGDAVVVTTEAEVEGTGALIVGGNTVTPVEGW